ncbi:Putative MetA-pathway of phenol degradation [Collimonas sp. OK242]|uniref:transporter n=1 Tax=Collimonas sp. OK242 TaxID=1798195 RepID=UPI0008946D48|nr:transporter [Collimonas sp. OK242]SDY05893.1 Putative MetA-pathway of phenol degradation [Collimonas sp. OK242]
MRQLLLTALSSCFLMQAAYANHPLVTDDTGTQDSGNHQLELNTDWLRQNDTHSHVANFTYSYGLLKNLDIYVNPPATLSQPSGINDIALGVKWRLLEHDDFSLGVKPEITFPSGDPNRGLGHGAASMSLTLLGSYQSGDWAFSGNLAAYYNRYRLTSDQQANRTMQWRLSAYALYEFSPKLSLALDGGILSNTERAGDTSGDMHSSSNPGYLLTGIIYSPTPNLDLDLGLKFGIGCGPCAAQTHRQVGVGATWRF